MLIVPLLISASIGSANAGVFVDRSVSAEARAEDTSLSRNQTCHRPTSASIKCVWDVQTSVGVEYFVTDPNDPISWGSNDSDVVSFSPSGEYFYFTTYYGNLDCDCYIMTMRFYETAAVRRSIMEHANRHVGIRPIREIRLATKRGEGTSGSGAGGAYWTGKNELIFRGRLDADAPTDLFEFSPASGELVNLTGLENEAASKSTKGLDLNLSVAAGDSAIYTTIQPAGYLSPENADYPIVAVRGKFLLNRFYSPQFSPLFRWEARVRDRSGRENVIASSVVTSLIAGGQIMPAVSPNGRWAAMVIPANVMAGAIPVLWRRYPGLAAFDRYDVEQQRRLFQVAIVDLHSQRVVSLLDAPLGPRETRPADSYENIAFSWSSDSRRVAIMNALSVDDARRPSDSYGKVMIFDVAGGQWYSSIPMRQCNEASAPICTKVDRVDWSADGRFLEARMREGEGTARTERIDWNSKALRGPRVAERPPAVQVPKPAPAISFEMTQSENDPPRLVAKYDGRSAVLFATNQGLEKFEWSRPIHISTPSMADSKSAAQLFLPAEQGKSGALIPLVIEIGEVDAGAFLPSGFATASYSTQAIVSRGFAVLRISGLPSEGAKAAWKKDQNLVPVHIAKVIDESTRHLSKKYHIDSTRVGLIGFSYFGWLAYYIATHPGEIVPAATLVSDSLTGSYMEYVMDTALNNEIGVVERDYAIRHAGHFWDNKTAWVSRAPGFNIERIQGPVLFMHSRMAINSPIFEEYGGFKLAGKQADFLLTPGDHQLRTPLAYEKSMQATVDWFDFWLSGHADQDPARDKLYFDYWRKLKADRDARLSIPK